MELVERFLRKIAEADAKGDKDKIADLVVGLNRTFSVMSPDEKVTILDYLVGRLIDCRSIK
jgi:hypothetical protein